MNFSIKLLCLAYFSYGQNWVLGYSMYRHSIPERSFYGHRSYNGGKNQQMMECTTDDSNRESSFLSRNGATDAKLRWTRFQVFPDKTYDEKERDMIRSAMKTLADIIPCVDFKLLDKNAMPTGDYVELVKGGCFSSHVGRKGGKQTISLHSPGCMSCHHILHEMLHALGFHHENIRPDRDDHICINYENMKDGRNNSHFIKLPAGTWSSFGIPYNIMSIMHSSSYASSINGKPTLLTKNGTKIPGFADLQKSDIAKLKAMYNCPSKKGHGHRHGYDGYNYDAAEEWASNYAEGEVNSQHENEQFWGDIYEHNRNGDFIDEFDEMIEEEDQIPWVSFYPNRNSPDFDNSVLDYPYANDLSRGQIVNTIYPSFEVGNGEDDYEHDSRNNLYENSEHFAHHIIYDEQLPSNANNFEDYSWNGHGNY